MGTNKATTSLSREDEQNKRHVDVFGLSLSLRILEVSFLTSDQGSKINRRRPPPGSPSRHLPPNG